MSHVFTIYVRALGELLKVYISLFVETNLKVPPLVHFTWFYKNSEALKPVEMKFYQMVSFIAAYKKIKPHRILGKLTRSLPFPAKFEKVFRDLHQPLPYPYFQNACVGFNSSAYESLLYKLINEFYIILICDMA